MPQGGSPGGDRERHPGGRDLRVARLAADRAHVELAREGRGDWSGSGIHVPSVSWVAGPNMTVTSASATLVGGEREHALLDEQVARPSWLSDGCPSASRSTTAACADLGLRSSMPMTAAAA